MNGVSHLADVLAKTVTRAGFLHRAQLHWEHALPHFSVETIRLAWGGLFEKALA